MRVPVAARFWVVTLKNSCNNIIRKVITKKKQISKRRMNVTLKERKTKNIKRMLFKRQSLDLKQELVRHQEKTSSFRYNKKV